MANVDAPFGLRAVRNASGSPYSGSVNQYSVAASYATSLFIGDAVKLSGTADADGVSGVVQAAAGDAIVGVICGFIPDGANLDQKYIPASTGGMVLVVDDPGVLFEIQEDSVGGALAAADTGLNASLVVGSGNTATGRSAMEIDSSTKATTATLALSLVGLSPAQKNDFGTNAKWLVKINKHQLANARTGV